MSVDIYDFVIGSGESNCCGAPSIGEVIDGLGMCSECKEWAEFEDEDD